LAKNPLEIVAGAFLCFLEEQFFAAFQPICSEAEFLLASAISARLRCRIGFYKGIFGFVCFEGKTSCLSVGLAP